MAEAGRSGGRELIPLTGMVTLRLHIGHGKCVLLVWSLLMHTVQKAWQFPHGMINSSLSSIHTGHSLSIFPLSGKETKQKNSVLSERIWGCVYLLKTPNYNLYPFISIFSHLSVVLFGPTGVLLRKLDALANWPVNLKLSLASFDIYSP